MGAELSRCGCGVEMRSEGKLDSNWLTPVSLQRLPGGKEASNVKSGMPGAPPQMLKENAQNQVEPQNQGADATPAVASPTPSARTLAARLLTDAKHGRTKNIQTMLDGQQPVLSDDQVKALLSATDQSLGNTPLMLAAKNGYPDCCEVLLKRGSDVHTHNRNGQTAIDLATREGKQDVVTVLKYYGAIDFPTI